MLLFDDLRHGLRLLRKTPGWTAVMALTLSLGIGLTTAIFSLVYSVLLQPLPYPAPERLMAVWLATRSPDLPRMNVNAADWLDWRAQSKSFEDIALTRPVANFNLTGSGAPERLQGARTSWNLPQVLGVQPLLGRAFTEQEEWQDAKVALLSYRLWNRRFGADPNLLGRSIQLNGAPYQVIGVMPPDFRYPSADFELWTPLYIPPDEIRARLGNDYISVGRLKPGIARERAQSEMSAVMDRIAAQYPGPNGVLGKRGIIVEPLLESTVGKVKGPLWILFGAVGCLLLIGCANLGNMLLARGTARSREMAVRVALGARASRLQSQLLAELLPLSIAGAAGGVLLAAWILHAMLPLLPAQMPRADAIGLHGWVLAFAIFLSLLVVLLAGMLPARAAVKVHLAETLQSGARTVSARSRVRDLLVGAQVAVTLLLLFGGGLLIRSLSALMEVQPGFATQGVLTMHLAITRARHPRDTDVTAYCDRLIDRVRSIPGVTGAGIVNRLPLSGLDQTGPVEFEGKPEAGIVNTDWRSATPGYFPAIGIALMRGRLFTPQDREGAELAGIIDDQIARRVFGDEDPVGRRFRMSIGNYHGDWTRIVGVVGHVRHGSLETDLRPQVYWPLAQRTQDREVLVVRTAGRPEPFTAAVVEQIHIEDPDQPVYDVRSMEEWLDRSLRSRDLLTTLVSMFAAASLVLACLGLYGVVSYTAGLRLREFGIRIALGAAREDIRSLVLKYAARVALAGSIAGLLLAWPVSQVLKSQLFGVSRLDWPSLIAAPSILLLVAFLAALNPARRAANADPVITLRAD